MPKKKKAPTWGDLDSIRIKALKKAGLRSLNQTKKLPTEKLLAIKGIGVVTARRILGAKFEEPKTKMGRDPIMTPERVKKLEEAFMNGLNVTEACSYSGITRQTYYNYMDEETGDKDFIDKITYAQNFVSIRAKQIVVEKMINDKDVDLSKWWIERKDPEFKDKGVNVNVNPQEGTKLTKEDKDELADIVERGKKARESYWKKKFKKLENDKKSQKNEK